jgi:alpha-N-arabinofuranosidase
MLFSSVLVAAFAAAANALDLKVAASGGNATSPLQYGTMFEVLLFDTTILDFNWPWQDINYSGDGGLYAELIRNRAFQGSTVHPSSLLAYGSVGGSTLSLKNLSQPLSSALPTSMNVATSKATGDEVGFSNT